MDDDTGAAVAYWRAGSALERYVTGFHRYSAPRSTDAVRHDAFFPGWATIRVVLHDSPRWSLKLGNRMFDPVPSVTLTGPTSCVGYVTSRGGTLMGVGLLPMGWAKLFGGDVSRFSNRMVPLSTVDAGAEGLGAALNATDNPLPVFAQWLEARLHRHPEPDVRIARLFAMLDDPATTRIEAMAEALEMTPRALAALTRFNFGFTPKLLLRRTRFLRAMSAVLTHPDDAPSLIDAAGYWDRSHFLRDSHLFLGCSIREFNKRGGTASRLAIRARADGLGSPV